MRVGIDTVDVARFRAVAARQPRLVPRLFTEAEREGLEGRHDAIPGFAARFAVKESMIKCLGGAPPGWKWHDMEVRTSHGGAPHLVTCGAIAQAATVLGLSELSISMSHDGTHAIAIVIGNT